MSDWGINSSSPRSSIESNSDLEFPDSNEENFASHHDLGEIDQETLYQLISEQPDLQVASSSSAPDEVKESINNLPGEPKVSEFELAKLDCIQVKHPVTGAPLDIPKRMLTGPLTNRSIDDQASFLQMKIAVGQDVAAKLMQGGQVDPTPDNISSLMWYLQVTAENKTGSAFSQGAISIDDPVQGHHGGNMRQFLDSSNLAYQRKSSHIGDFQKLQDGYPRGINLYGLQQDHSDLLPYGKQTVLFQAMGTNGTNDLKGMPRNMLLLKMEEHGCFSSSEQKNGRGPTRAETSEDKSAFWGHVGTTVSSFARRATGNNTPLGSRKERISSGLKKSYDNLKGKFPKDIQAILSQHKPTGSSNGIRVMAANIAEAQLRLTERGDEKGYQLLKDFVDTHFSDARYDHYDVRIGEEVILTQKDI